MRSYDGYRALFVLATILAHMTGTLTVRVTNNKQTSKRSSGESSSSALILFFHILFSFRFRMSVLLFRCTRKSLPPSSRSRAALRLFHRATCFFLLPLLRADALSYLSSAFLVRVILFLHSSFLETSNTLFYFYFFYFLLFSFSHLLDFPYRSLKLLLHFRIFLWI